MKINDFKKLLIISETVLGMIMIFFLVFSLVASYRATVNELQDNAALLADRHASFLNQVMYSSRAFADRERSDKKYSNYYRGNDIISKLEVMEDIRNFRNLTTFFDYIFYVDAVDMSVWGANGRYEMEYFSDVFEGFAPDQFKDFMDSDSKTLIIPAYMYSLPVVSIFVKSMPSSNVAFAFFIDRNYISRYLGPVELDDVMSEDIFFDDICFFSSEGEMESKAPLFTSIEMGEYVFNYHVDGNWIIVQTFRTSAIFILTVIVCWGLCAYLLFNLMKRWYAPLDKVMTHIGMTDDIVGTASTSDAIIDSYDELKAQSQKFETDVILFRMLFSGKHDDKVLEEYGLNIEGAYYFFCLFSSEDDYLLTSAELDKLQDTKQYRIYISDKNIVAFVVSRLDIMTLEKQLEQMKANFTSVTFSTISDDVRYLRYCYSNAEQERISSRLQDSVGYPYDEIRQLSVSMGMDNYERALFVYNQLMLIVEKADLKLKNDILYDMAKILVKPDERVSLNSVRYNRGQLESLLQGCKERLISECKLRGKRNDKKRKLERNIDSIEAYVKEHCMEKDYSLKRLAFEFNMSYSNLCHYYKDNTGHTVTEFTDQFKLERAKILMSSGMKIYDVSARLGYNSPQTFSRVFKKYEGKLPKAYMMENCESVDDVDEEKSDD